MKIPSSYLRRQLGTLLTGNVTYNDGEGFNAVVPVVSSEGVESKYQIFIGDYSDSDRSNKQNFGARGTQVIEVIESDSITKGYKHVDAIGEILTELILPTTQAKNLNGTDFQIIVNRPSVNHLSEKDGDARYTNRLILRYSLNINHN